MTGARKVRALLLAAIVVASTTVALAPAPAGAAAAANTDATITQEPSFVTSSDNINKTSQQVEISTDTNLSFDGGNNYQFVFRNEDSGDSVTLSVNGSFTLTTEDRLAFLLYNGDGTTSLDPQLWYLPESGDSTLVDVTVEDGSIPSASGLTNFSVELQDSAGNSISRTDDKASVIGYEGLIAQNSTEGDVRLSVPRDVVPETSSVTLRFNGTSHSMQYESATDSFVTIIDAGFYEANDYGYKVTYEFGGRQVLQIGDFTNRSSAVNITSPKTVSISREVGPTLTEGNHSTNQVGINNTDDIEFDSGNNYLLRVTNDETGESVTIRPDESFTLTSEGQLGFALYEPDGTRLSSDDVFLGYNEPGFDEPRVVNATVVDGAVPSASGPTNFSVTLVDASDGTELDTTESRPSVVGYEGALRQNSTDGDVRLSIPADNVPTTANVSVAISNENGTDKGPMTYNANTDRFEVVINASNYPSDAYSWGVLFELDDWPALEVFSPDSDNEFIKLNNVSVSGTVTLADGSAAGGHTLRFASETGNDSQVVTNTDGTYQTSVEPATTYEVGVVQADVSQDGWTLPEDDTVDFWPAGIGSATSDVTDADINLPVGHTLNVTVVSAHTGEPIENANVRVIKTNNGTRIGIDGNTTADGVWNPPTEGTGAEVNGTVAVEVLAPQGSLYENESGNVTVTEDHNLTVELDGPANVVGGVEYTNGSAANGTVLATGEQFAIMDLDGNGRYDTANRRDDSRDDLPSPGTHRFVYLQIFDDEPFDSFAPDDGNPDVAYLTTVTDPAVGTTDVGTQSLTSAHEVNVTVVDRTGDPVEGAAFQMLARSPNDVVASGWIEPNATNADGLVHLRGKDAPGVELVGDYQLGATGPVNSTKYASAVNTTNVSVTGDRSLTLTVEETNVSPESADFGTVDLDDSETVTVTVTNDGDFEFEADDTTIVGSNAGQFAIVSGGGNFTLEPGESHEVTVEFQPEFTGSKSAALRFDNPGPSSAPPLEVPLSGEGFESASDDGTSTPTPTPTNNTSTPTPTPTDVSDEESTDTPEAESTDTPTDEPTDTPTEEPTDTPTVTDTPTDEPTDAPADTPTVTDTPAPTTTGSPGFGFVVAVLALLAAGLLARRRD